MVPFIEETKLRALVCPVPSGGAGISVCNPIIGMSSGDIAMMECHSQTQPALGLSWSPVELGQQTSPAL